MTIQEKNQIKWHPGNLHPTVHNVHVTQVPADSSLSCFLLSYLTLPACCLSFCLWFNNSLDIIACTDFLLQHCRDQKTTWKWCFRLTLLGLQVATKVVCNACFVRIFSSLEQLNSQAQKAEAASSYLGCSFLSLCMWLCLVLKKLQQTTAITSKWLSVPNKGF